MHVSLVPASAHFSSSLPVSAVSRRRPGRLRGQRTAIRAVDHATDRQARRHRFHQEHLGAFAPAYTPPRIRALSDPTGHWSLPRIRPSPLPAPWPCLRPLLSRAVQRAEHLSPTRAKAALNAAIPSSVTVKVTMCGVGGTRVCFFSRPSRCLRLFLCLSPLAFCLSPLASRLLPFAFCLLPFVFCLLSLDVALALLTLLTYRAVKRAEHRSLVWPKSSPCLSEASLGCVPRQARSTGDRRGAAASARVRRWRFDSRLRHSPSGPASPFASAFALSCLLLTRQK